MKLDFKVYKAPQHEWKFGFSLRKEYWGIGNWYFFQISLFKRIFSLRLDTTKGGVK